MVASWRLIESGPGTGAFNMAVDEAILEAVAAGASPPTLRLYAWDPPCLSLGHAQPAEVVDEPALIARGWHRVRRPTGGRALLHADELTYAVVAPEDHPAVAGGVIAGYRRLSAGLVAGLERLGMSPDPPRRLEAQDDDRGNPVCFEVPSAYEVTIGGKKLIGSAQLRRLGAVLQHGSLPLGGDLGRVVACLRYPDEAARREAARRLLAHATTSERHLGRAVGWEEAATAIATGFATALGWDLHRADLTSAEVARAEELVSSRYAIEIAEPPPLRTA